MSNLHKNLVDAQIHVPKGFATAANDTKLTKNSTGILEWAADSGGGGVSSIVAGTGITISPVTGLGDVTINSSATSNNFVSRNIKCYGSIATGVEFGLGSPVGNNEHKFITNLGTPSITTMTPRNMTTSSIWVNPTAGSTLKNWNGWIYGVAGIQVALSLLRVKLTCPIEGEYPTSVPVCRTATQNLTMTGNATPLCFNISSFETCEGWAETMQANEVLVLSASTGGKDIAVFTINTNIMVGLI